jgi:hypothetical protein
MVAAFLLSTFLSLPASQSQSRAVAFQPRLTVHFQAARPASRRPTVGGEREIVCGMVVVKVPSDLDEKMLLPYRETGAAVRRVEPAVCAAARSVPAK